MVKSFHAEREIREISELPVEGVFVFTGMGADTECVNGLGIPRNRGGSSLMKRWKPPLRALCGGRCPDNTCVRS
jgi:hypothetical protein